MPSQSFARRVAALYFSSDRMQIVEVTSPLRKPHSSTWSDKCVVDTRSISHSFAGRKCRGFACAFLGGSVYFLCLSRARFDDNIALYDRKSVRNSYTRNTRVPEHAAGGEGEGGRGRVYAINIQFSKRIGLRVLPRAQISVVFPHFIATNNAVIMRTFRTHCQALRRVRSSTGNVEKLLCIGLTSRFFRFSWCEQYVDSKTFRNN